MQGMHSRWITPWVMAFSIAAGGAVAQSPQPAAKVLATPAAPVLPQAWPEHRPRVEITATTRFGDDETFAPWRVADGWASSMWCEGAPGDGLNQALTFRFDVPQRFARIDVQGGAMASSEHFLANDVPIGWELRTDTGVRLHAKDTALTPVQTGRGPTGLTTFRLPQKPLRSFQLRIEGLLRKDGGAHACVSEVRLHRHEVAEPVPIAPVPLDPKPYLALPRDLQQILTALSSCDEAALGTHLQYPFTWDVEEPSLHARGATVTPVTTLEFHHPSELSRTCRERPFEAPLPPPGTTVQSLLHETVVEAKDRVSITFPSAVPDAQGMRWWLSFRGDRWVVVELQR